MSLQKPAINTRNTRWALWRFLDFFSLFIVLLAVAEPWSLPVNSPRFRVNIGEAIRFDIHACSSLTIEKRVSETGQSIALYPKSLIEHGRKDRARSLWSAIVFMSCVTWFIYLTVDRLFDRWTLPLDTFSVLSLHLYIQDGAEFQLD